MKIGELPEDIYDVALQRVDEYGINIGLNLNDLDITFAFDWSFTPEGVRIWSDVDIGDFDSFRDSQITYQARYQASTKLISKALYAMSTMC